MEILALDVGAARVGVARGSTKARLAEPLKTIKTSEAIMDLQNIISQTGVGLIVVGLPRNLAGENTDQTYWVRAWVAAAQVKINLPFYWQDEALTSQESMSNEQRTLFRQGYKGQAKSKRTKNKFDEHARAAVVILQDFFDTPKKEQKLVLT